MRSNDRPPRVSIGLPVYNGERYLPELFESLLQQTYRDFEIIVSDNASTDTTEQICRAHAEKDSRVRYVRKPENIGIVRNFNSIVELARGELFKWQAHDDLCAPRFLEACVEALDTHPQAVLAYTKAGRIDGTGAAITDDLYRVGDKQFVVGAWDEDVEYDSPDVVERCLQFLRPGRPAAPMYLFGVMRIDVLRSTRLHGNYLAGDEVFLLEMLLKGPFVRVKEPLFFVRHFDDNGTALWLLGDFMALQKRMDPALATPLGVVISKNSRYPQYAVAISQASISASDKARLLASLGERVFERASLVLKEVVRGERTFLGRPRA